MTHFWKLQDKRPYGYLTAQPQTTNLLCIFCIRLAADLFSISAFTDNNDH